MIRVKDTATKEVFELLETSYTHVVTKDGARVRLHPAWIKFAIEIGDFFDGITLLGPREFRRIS